MLRKITIKTLQEKKKKRKKIVALTCYDATMARLLNQQVVDFLLVGDSVGNVKLGYENTLPVTLEEILHHTRAVKRGNSHALLVADMPFLTYEYSPADAVRSVGRLIKEGGAEAVKVEGSETILSSIEALIKTNIPVMGHLGLTPQSVHRMGGYRLQGRDKKEAAQIKAQAKNLESAGVFAVVLEGIPESLAKEITDSLSIPTIGIGAGKGCDGQILVIDDLLGFSDKPFPRFVKTYASFWKEASKAVKTYCQEVSSGKFPGKKHSYD